jgi:LysM repeat protein
MTPAHRISKIARPGIILSILILVLAVVASATPRPTAAQSGGTTHTVQAGENLFRIALRYGYTAEYLASVNGITDPTMIYVGQVLIIPDSAAPAVPTDPFPAAVDPAPASTDPWQVNPSPVDLGILPTASMTTASPVYHVVQRGETLASIALAHGVTWADLAAANGLADPNHIFAGQQLAIPGTTAPGTAAVAPAVVAQQTVADPFAPAYSTTGTEQTHVVQPGEHLAAIARAYGLSWPTIARANNISDPNQIYAGQTLIIPAADDGQGAYAQPATWTPSAAPAPTLTTGKQIVVDLSDQSVYAYENGQLLRSTLVSTGVSYYPTVVGDFKVYLKYESQLMSGPGYYLPGVPYVLYFYQGYSLHGTYWHSNFGTPMSHGCVNMPTSEAQWIWSWAPIGTPVHVQY